MDDQKLVYLCRQGDAEALSRIYDTHREHLLILAMTLTGSMTDAEDVLHDTFLGFVRNLRSFRLTGTLKGYLSICVANQARNHRTRASYRKTAGLDQAEQLTAEQFDPVEGAIGNEYVHLLSQAMCQLPLEQREVVALHLFSELPFKEIAKHVHAPLSTIKSRYRYGIMKLQSILSHEALP